MRRVICNGTSVTWFNVAMPWRIVAERYDTPENAAARKLALEATPDNQKASNFGMVERVVSGMEVNQ